MHQRRRVADPVMSRLASRASAPAATLVAAIRAATSAAPSVAVAAEVVTVAATGSCWSAGGWGPTGGRGGAGPRGGGSSRRRRAAWGIYPSRVNTKSRGRVYESSKPCGMVPCRRVSGGRAIPFFFTPFVTPLGSIEGRFRPHYRQDRQPGGSPQNPATQGDRGDSAEGERQSNLALKTWAGTSRANTPEVRRTIVKAPRTSAKSARRSFW